MEKSVQATLGEALCLNLRSFRISGVPVDTPIWVVQIGDRLGAFTDDRSFKFKRVRRNPAVEVAGCDVWGRCFTPWYPAQCRIVTEPDQRTRIFDAIAQKYGIHWKMSTWGSMLVGRIKHRVVLEFEVTPTPLGTTYNAA